MTSPSFEQLFSRPYDARATAHGRVNLIGEHTDYCDGFVMPTLISQTISVEVAVSDVPKIAGFSDSFGKSEADLSEVPQDSWLIFVKGAIALLQERGCDIIGVMVRTQSDIPAGAGVSSSAAFEIALLKALCAACHHQIEASEMALLGQKIEHDYVGTKCGIMDQMAVAHAKTGQALFLDCRSLATEMVDLPKGHDLAVIHSGSSRTLSSSAYNERLAQTIEAARLCDVAILRDANLSQLSAITDETVKRRARHVISENDRVIQAKQALIDQDAVTIGRLFYESHASLRDDYEVTSQSLDKLVDDAKSLGVLGARVTGAGFGGCIVALLRSDTADQALDALFQKNPDAWLVDRHQIS